MTIDRESLNGKQKTIYDMWVNITKKDPEDPELIELLGLVPKTTSRVRKEAIEAKEAVSREAEAVLLHLRRQNTLLQKVCPECHLPFATNYHFVARCSDDCLSRSLAKIGITWKAEKSAMERWNGPNVNGEIPAIITPDTLKFLKSWARVILSWDEPKEETVKEIINKEFDRIRDDLNDDWAAGVTYDAADEWTDPETEIQEERLVGSVPATLDDPFADI